MTARTTPPFRADHVGGFLRPAYLLQAREQFFVAKCISAAQLRAVDLGVDDFLNKPVNLTELTTRVRSLLALKRFTDELEHAARVLESLASVVERRDGYTGLHCQRVGAYARLVGSALGLDEETLDVVRLGGVLHDKRTADKLTEAIVQQLCEARSFDQANRLAALLSAEAPLLTRAQAARLREAEKTNGELQGAFDFDSHVSSIEAKLAVTDPVPAVVNHDEEPF